MSISPATKLTAIFGHPVTHSLSPTLHNAVYQKDGIDAVMLAFGNSDVAPLVSAMRSLPIHLAAVTMPHKQTIMPLLDVIDEEASDIGSVNTVVNREGKLTGYNTDIAGVAAALKGVSLKGTDALLIGAGGAARTVAYFLKKEGANILCANRERSQADELLKAFGGTFIDAADVAKRSFPVIINATPVGMSPNTDAMPVPESAIEKDGAVFDLVYSPLETKFLATAKARGAKAVSGLTMFLAQGLEQERLWLGREFESSWYSKFLEDHLKSH